MQFALLHGVEYLLNAISFPAAHAWSSCATVLCIIRLTQGFWKSQLFLVAQTTLVSPAGIYTCCFITTEVSAFIRGAA